MILALSLVSGLLSVPAAATEVQPESAVQVTDAAERRGSCGENVSWTLEEQVLTIAGTGAMACYDLEDNQAPWAEYKEEITEVRLENGVESIGDYAFYGLNKLGKAEIPESVTMIGEYAFSGCALSADFVLPETVIDVAETAFEPVEKSAEKTDPAQAEETDIEEPTQEDVPDSVQESEEASEEESQGEADTEDAETEAAAAYSGDSEISVYASTSITKGDWTYAVVDGRAYIESYNGYSSYVAIPTSVTLNGVNYKIRSIGESAFAGNVYLRSVVIPASITRIENCAFKNCTNLGSVTINGDIGDASSYSTNSSSGWSESSNKNSVFYNAGTNTDGMTVTFGSGVTYVPGYLFATGYAQSDDVYAHVKRVVLSSAITEIGIGAFYRCYDLNQIEFGNAPQLTTIGDKAFYNCSLQSLSFNGANGLKTIGAYAFSNTKITSISMPANVSAIKEGAFQDCYSLTTVTLPKKLVQLGNIAFKNCTNLQSITINGDIGDASSYSTNSSSGWSESSDKNSIFYNAGTNTDGMTVTFGSGVTYVPAYLFATGYAQSDDVYAHVKRVVLSSAITEIGARAFYNCYDLVSVNFSSASRLKTVDDYAFCDTGLRTLSFANNLTAINEGAFAWCDELKTVTLPQSLTYLGKLAFKNCTGLKSLTINCDLPDASSGSTHSSSGYNESSDRNSIFYNAGTNTDGMMVYFSARVTRIPAYLFATGYGKSSNVYANIKRVSIPCSVRSIGKYAFGRCYNLQSFDFRGDVVDIDENAFYGVTAKAYYLRGTKTWVPSVRQNYGGTIQWYSKAGPVGNVTLTSANQHTTGNIIRWASVQNAQFYQVYRRTLNGNWTFLTNTSSTAYKDTTAARGVYYYYTVRARNGGDISPQYAAGYRLKRP